MAAAMLKSINNKRKQPTPSNSVKQKCVESASAPENIEYPSITRAFTHVNNKLHARIGWGDLYIPVDTAQITFAAEDDVSEIPYVKERDPEIPTLDEWQIDCARNRQTLAQRKKCGSRLFMCPYCKRRGWLGKKENCRIHIRGCNTASRKQNACSVMVEAKKHCEKNGEVFIEKEPVVV